MLRSPRPLPVSFSNPTKDVKPKPPTVLIDRKNRKHKRNERNKIRWIINIQQLLFQNDLVNPVFPVVIPDPPPTNGCLRLTSDRGSSNSSKCRTTSSTEKRRVSAGVSSPCLLNGAARGTCIPGKHPGSIRRRLPGLRKVSAGPAVRCRTSPSSASGNPFPPAPATKSSPATRIDR